MDIESRDEQPPTKQAADMMSQTLSGFNLWPYPRKPVGPGIGKGKSRSKFQNRGSQHVQVRHSRPKGKKKFSGGWD